MASRAPDDISPEEQAYWEGRVEERELSARPTCDVEAAVEALARQMWKDSLIQVLWESASADARGEHLRQSREYVDLILDRVHPRPKER